MGRKIDCYLFIHSFQIKSTVAASVFFPTPPGKKDMLIWSENMESTSQAWLKLSASIQTLAWHHLISTIRTGVLYLCIYVRVYTQDRRLKGKGCHYSLYQFNSSQFVQLHFSVRCSLFRELWSKNYPKLKLGIKKKVHCQKYSIVDFC